MSRRRTTHVRSQRASQSAPALQTTLARSGPMSKKLIKHLLSGVYYSGIKIVTTSGDIMDITDMESIRDIGLTTVVNYATEEFVSPMVKPMIPVQNPMVQKLIDPTLNAVTTTAASVLLDYTDSSDAPIEFLYHVGANVAANMTDDAVSGILGY